MRHLKTLLLHKNLKHIKHPVVKVHVKAHTRIIGSGTAAHKKNYDEMGSGISRCGSGVRQLKPLKFKF